MRTLHALALFLSLLAAPLLADEEIDPRIESFFTPPSEFA